MNSRATQSGSTPTEATAKYNEQSFLVRSTDTEVAILTIACRDKSQRNRKAFRMRFI